MSGRVHELSYSRRHRYTGMSAYAPVLRDGVRWRSPEAALVLATGKPGASRLGVVLPRRLARKATTRNRMKRIAREVFRQHPARNSGHDLVVLPRAAYGRAGGRAWAAVVRSLLDRATVINK